MGFLAVTTKEAVKNILAISESTNQDDRINAAITLVSAQLENLLDRFIKEEAQTEFFDIEPGQQAVMLRGIPVVGAITSVHNDTEHVFDSTTVIDATNFVHNKDDGRLMFDRIVLTHGPQVLQVKYTGGMATTTPLFRTAFPGVSGLADLQVIRILSHWFRGGSADFELEAGEAGLNFWAAGVRRALVAHRRWEGR